MADKELRKLSRKQLLELLLKLTERSEELQAELDVANRKLNDKLLIKSEAGSIADAALKLNGVFEAAEKAAEQYLDNIKLISENRDSIIRRVEDDCKRRSAAIISRTKKRCAELERESTARADAIIAAAEARGAEIDAEYEKKMREMRRLYKLLLEEKKKIERKKSKTNG